MSDKVICRLAPSRRQRRSAGLRHTRRIECSSCTAHLLATPATMLMIEQGVASPMCEPCGAREVAASGREPVLLVTTENADEVEARRLAMARRLGVRAEDVVAWSPATLRAAIDALRRAN